MFFFITNVISVVYYNENISVFGYIQTYYCSTGVFSFLYV